MLNWDLDTETNVKVWGRYTLNEGNKRGDWMKHWMMLQGYTALNTMYRKHFGNKRRSDLQKEKKSNYLHIDQEKILETQ